MVQTSVQPLFILDFYSKKAFILRGVFFIKNKAVYLPLLSTTLKIVEISCTKMRYPKVRVLH
jgi:hypothetical protein